MSDQNDNQQAELDEELELELELEGTEEPAEDKKDKIIKSLLARAKKAESLVKSAKRPQTIIREEPKDFFEDERLDLLSQGYSKDQIKFIMNNGGTKALEDSNSLVSLALKTQKEQKKAEEAASRVEDTSHLSEVERKYTDEQLRNMSLEELKKILPHAE